MQTVQVIGSALRVGGGGEDRPALALENAQPVAEALRVVVAHFRGDAEIGAQEGRSHFRNEFLRRIGAIAKTLAQFAVIDKWAAAARVPGPLRSGVTR